MYKKLNQILLNFNKYDSKQRAILRYHTKKFDETSEDYSGYLTAITCIQKIESDVLELLQKRADNDQKIHEFISNLLDLEYYWQEFYAFLKFSNMNNMLVIESLQNQKFVDEFNSKRNNFMKPFSACHHAIEELAGLFFVSQDYQKFDVSEVKEEFLHYLVRFGDSMDFTSLKFQQHMEKHKIYIYFKNDVYLELRKYIYSKRIFMLSELSEASDMWLFKRMQDIANRYNQQCPDIKELYTKIIILLTQNKLLDMNFLEQKSAGITSINQPSNNQKNHKLEMEEMVRNYLANSRSRACII